MIALIQRVSRAQVTVRSEVVASASRGILALIGIAATDSIETGARLIDRVLGYRIFADEAGKMNLSIRDIDGDLVLVPQFTLVAETSKGNRPGFSGGASPDQARALYGKLLMTARTLYPKVASGVFGADMQVELVNDGPATFWLEARNGA
ncbi:MAG: D-aminoacyl-tRNA deacylase [Pseudomonadota bacterium]